MLTFGQTQQVEDSYYFTIDPNVNPGDESPEKAARVMASLLDQWLDRLTSEKTVYLPVGFSDQSMTWLRAEKSGDVITLTLGWSEDEGWSVNAASLGEASPAVFTAMEDVAPLQLYAPRLLSLLRSNRCYLAGKGEPAT